MKTTDQGISLKLFFGALLTPDIKIKLLQSKSWLEDTLGGDRSIEKMQIVDYRNNEYLGIYIERPITLAELRSAQLHCQNLFRHYLPDVNIDAFKPMIFPQIFIS